MRQRQLRRPIELKQLCAIARAILQEAPTIDDFEWLEAIKWRLVKQGWTHPKNPEDLWRATVQVEKAWERTHGRRPRREPTLPPAVPTNTCGPLTATEAQVFHRVLTGSNGCAPTSRPAGFEALGDLMVPAEPQPPRPTTREQIDTARSNQPRPLHRHTAKGWVRVTGLDDDDPATLPD